MILLIHQTGLDLGLRRQIAVDGMELFAITGHVLELHLESFSEDEYYASGATAYYGEYLEKSAFRGKISDSLLNLKNLKYLDLSNNNFGGIPFPKFLGSMRSLRHLNLDTTGFGGIIPYQLGNLSNLQYLSIRGFLLGCYVENFHWLTGMVSLEFLDFNLVNLSQASDWLNMINTLPSLVELHISYCRLPNVSPLLEVNFLSLSILDLSGTFDFVQNITWLKALDLSSNYLNSSIPNWLYSFSHLELLNLCDNQLQGKIASGVGKLTSLVSID
ncbi:receptor-like protein EIX1 [Jatropha curcas]|uniref:receptor-like protein EIX1 n=1 Tax=Jatropha curcas TaxID=180498 RepID=UPI001895A38E|nr:receptor-like protein EIX1 [Jatropha curcas]